MNRKNMNKIKIIQKYTTLKFSRVQKSNLSLCRQMISHPEFTPHVLNAVI